MLLNNIFQLFKKGVLNNHLLVFIYCLVDITDTVSTYFTSPDLLLESHFSVKFFKFGWLGLLLTTWSLKLIIFLGFLIGCNFFLTEKRNLKIGVKVVFYFFCVSYFFTTIIGTFMATVNNFFVYAYMYKTNWKCVDEFSIKYMPRVSLYNSYIDFSYFLIALVFTYFYLKKIRNA